MAPLLHWLDHSKTAAMFWTSETTVSEKCQMFRTCSEAWSLNSFQVTAVLVTGASFPMLFRSLKLEPFSCYCSPGASDCLFRNLKNSLGVWSLDLGSWLTGLSLRQKHSWTSLSTSMSAIRMILFLFNPSYYDLCWLWNHDPLLFSLGDV